MLNIFYIYMKAKATNTMVLGAKENLDRVIFYLGLLLILHTRYIIYKGFLNVYTLYIYVYKK